MDEEQKVYISRGHKFFIGINHVSIEKILLWRGEEDIDWFPFLWYISRYVYITDFGGDWMKIKISKKKNLTRFYRYAVAYDSSIWKKVYCKYAKNITNKIQKKCNSGSTESLIRKKILSTNLS